MHYTIIGSSGFIGSNLTEYFRKQKIECLTPNIRNESIKNKDLGNVIFTIGVSTFFEKPFDMVKAHVSILNEILEEAEFQSILYVSTGRFYYGVKNTNEEYPILVNPLDENELYNISKLAGESLCISSKRNNVKIVRPTNIIGMNAPSNLFIPSIINQAIKENKITLHSSLESERDYIHIDDVVKIIPDIIHKGKENIYNIASGRNIKNREIVDEISKITGCEIEVEENSPIYSSPNISIDKIKSEFQFSASSIIPKLKEIIDFQKKSC